MLIKLTNANAKTKQQGDPIYIEADNIISIFPITAEMVKDDVVMSFPRTAVFCPPHGTWEVMESIDDVYNIVNSIKD